MSATIIRTRIFKKVYEDDVCLNVKPGSTRLQLVGLAKSTVLSSFENLALISPSSSHEKDLVCASANPRLTFELPNATASNMSPSMSQLQRQLEALTRETTSRFEKQEDAIKLLEDDNTHLKSDNIRLKINIQKLNDRIRPLACIALRVFLDAYLAIKGYTLDKCGSRQAWISRNIRHLLPNTGISQARFEHLLNKYRDVANVSAHSAESLEVALAIEVMGEGKAEFSELFEDCLGHSIEAEIDKCIPSTCIDGRDERRAGQRVVRFITTRPHAKSRACKAANAGGSST